MWTNSSIMYDRDCGLDFADNQDYQRWYIEVVEMTRETFREQLKNLDVRVLLFSVHLQRVLKESKMALVGRL